MAWSRRERSGGEAAARQGRRTAWAAGLSLVLHLLALTGMVLGLKVVAPPPEERAMEISLLPPPLPPQIAARRAATPQKPAAAPVLKPHLALRPAPQVPGVALPEAKAPPAPPPAEPYGPVESPGGLKPGLSGRMGCDDPLGFKLNEAQKQACANNMAARAREAGALGFAMSAAKQKRFERNANCRQAMRAAGIPSANDAEFLPKFSALPPGLVPAPSFKDCPLNDR